MYSFCVVSNSQDALQQTAPAELLRETPDSRALMSDDIIMNIYVLIGCLSLYLPVSLSCFCQPVALPLPLSFAPPSPYSFSSLAIFEAMFLKAMEVPEIRLKRTPLSERRGSLHTSISHWTRPSACPSPWTQSIRKLSRCS